MMTVDATLMQGTLNDKVENGLRILKKDTLIKLYMVSRTSDTSFSLKGCAF